MNALMNEFSDGLPRVADSPRVVPRPERSQPAPSEPAGQPASPPAAAPAWPASSRPVDEHTSLVHTATPRRALCASLVVTGLFALWRVVTNGRRATVGPGDVQLDRVLALGAIVTLGTGLWWAVAAAVNGRRLTRGETVGPYLAPAAYLGVGGIGIAQAHFVEGGIRSLAFVGWLLAAVGVHYLVVASYRESAATLGSITTEFDTVARIPALASVAVIAAVHRWGLVAGPVLAVFAGWFVLVLHRAMAGWDRVCEKRLAAARRDQFSDGEVPIQVLPAVVPSVAQAIPAATGNDASPLKERPGPARQIRNDGHRTDLRSHHTLIPRALCLGGFLAQLLMTVLVVLLVRAGHGERVDGEFVFDDMGSTALTTVGVGASLCYLVGWLWWAVAAALNARLVTNRGVKWWSAPVGYSVAAAVFLLASRASQRDGTELVALVPALLVHFGLLGAYRRTASMVGSVTTYFTRLIVLPWIAIAFAGAASFFLHATEQPMRVMLFVVLQVVVALMGLSTYQAMSTWDRAVVANGDKRSDDAALPAFLRQRAVSAG